MDDAVADAADKPALATSSTDGIAAPLRYATFRRIWLASLVSNLGSLIQGVGVAWAMTQMTTSVDKVALVQTALWLPTVLIALPAGAIADVHDRRIVALVSLALALVAATTLAVTAALGIVTPELLLILCFAVGCGAALMGPAWQAAVSEQVPPEALPSAVALNGISYNIARSLGPAIGGILVATAGTVATFAVNALSFLPLMVALFLWQRNVPRSPLPPERVSHAIALGVRYVANSPSVRTVVIRSILTGLLSGAILALMPLVARDVLHGDSKTYGVLLSAMGLGAVIGALNISQIRKRMSSEAAIRACSLCMGAGMAVMAFSRSPALTAAGVVLAGTGWTLSWTFFNVGVQFSAPRWVAARSLAVYQAASAAGLAAGSWAWGHVADVMGVEPALAVAAALMAASPLVGVWLCMPSVGQRAQESNLLEHPEVKLPISGDDGPVVIEIEYHISQADAQAFVDAMNEVQLVRQRNGAYGWSIARDIADVQLWLERFHCPTWHDYLRQRNRPTQGERAIEAKAMAFHSGPGKIRVRRMLERPRV